MKSPSRLASTTLTPPWQLQYSYSCPGCLFDFRFFEEPDAGVGRRAGTVSGWADALGRVRLTESGVAVLRSSTTLGVLPAVLPQEDG
jgi:hypothetical protein